MMEKQIEEMAKIMCKECGKSLGPCEGYMCEASLQQAKALYEEGCRMQSEGEWEQSGLSNPKCSLCRTYNYEKSNYCPKCGAHMKGGES